MNYRSSLLSSFALAALLVAIAGGVAAGFGGAAAILFKATFAAAEPEFGTMTTFTEDGSDIDEVAPGAGVVGGEFVFTEAEGAGAVDYGLECWTTVPSNTTTQISFDLEVEDDTTAFDFEITDTNGIDITKFSMGADVDGGGGGGNLGGCRFAINLVLYPHKAGGKDLYVLTVSDVDCGENVVNLVGAIPGGFRPVAAVRFTKGAGETGAFAVDDIEIKSVP